MGEVIKRFLDFNVLTVDLVYDKTLWRHLIHVTNPT